MNASVGERYSCSHLVIFAQVAPLHLNKFIGRRTKILKYLCISCPSYVKKQRLSGTDVTIVFLVSEFIFYSESTRKILKYVKKN
jgi:hypothetical protein